MLDHIDAVNFAVNHVLLLQSLGIRIAAHKQKVDKMPIQPVSFYDVGGYHDFY
jgi:hypothetical protein